MSFDWTLTATGGTATFDETEVRRALAVMLAPGKWHFVQVLKSALWSYVYADDIDGAISTLRGLGSGEGTYVSLNSVDAPLEHALLASDVRHRHWFLVDIDAKRPDTSESSTDDEKAAAGDVATRIDAYLADAGWPAPLLIDSGNAWHLVYRIDLPADKIVQAYLRRALKALGSMFDTDGVQVDKSTHDSRRITKLPGSWVRKGPNTDDRPHRMARIVVIPDQLVPVPLDLIKNLAEHSESKGAPKPEPKPFDPWVMHARNGNSQDLSHYFDRALELECNALAMANVGDRNNALNRAAFSMGTLVPLGLDEGKARVRLTMTANQLGLSDREITLTIASGMDAGKQNPRQIPDRQTKKTTADEPHGIPRSKLIIWAKDVTPKQVDWLWPRRIPLGKMTTFAGQGGIGKTFTLCDIAARISTGSEWPLGEGECAPQGRVLFISAEDDIEDTLVPRLISLGADLSQIAFLSPESEGKFDLSKLDLLSDIITEMKGAKMVAIDPPTSFLNGVDSHKDAELRELLAPLKRWCAERKAALVFNNHVNKATGQNVDAAARVMGSVAWVNGVRAAHLFMKDAENPDHVSFTCIKINSGPKGKGLLYTIKPTTGDNAVIEWLSEIDLTSDEAARGERRKPRGVVAAEFIEGLFRQKPRWPALELDRLCTQAGISKNARKEASAKLPIQWRHAHDEHGERYVEWYVAREDWPPRGIGLPGHPGLPET